MTSLLRLRISSNCLGGEYTIERYHSKTEFGFEIHSNSDALQKMQERLIEVLEDEKKWWKFYRAYEERIGRLSEEGLHFSRIWEEHRLGWIHDIDKGAIEK